MNRFQFVADHQDTFEGEAAVRGRRGQPVLVLRLAERRARRGQQRASGRRRARRSGSGPCTTTTRPTGPRGSPPSSTTAPTAEERVNHKRVARVMREHGIAGYRRRRRVRTTIPEPADSKVPDLLKRDFTAPAPNQRYVGDITYLPLCRRGEPVPGHRDRLLLPPAGRLGHRRPHAHRAGRRRPQSRGQTTRGSLAGAIFHSDHGSVYTSEGLTPGSAPSSGSPSPWARSGPAPTTASPNRSTPP